MDLSAILATLPWNTVGWLASILLIFALLLHGDLILKKYHEELIELWKDAYQKQFDSRVALEDSVDKLSDGMETVIRIVNALPSIPKED